MFCRWRDFCLQNVSYTWEGLFYFILGLVVYSNLTLSIIQYCIQDCINKALLMGEFNFIVLNVKHSVLARQTS